MKRWHSSLLGSAALDLMRQSNETLAGRVAYLDIAPLNIGEMAPAGIAANELWLRGGLPDSGVLHGLLELETLNDLLGHPVCGLSFEGHCIENLIQAAGSRPEIAIEVKRSMAPRRLACRSWPLCLIYKKSACSPRPTCACSY